MDQNQHVYLYVKVWAEKINLSHVVVFGVTVILFWITYPRVRYPKENDWWWWFIFKQDFSTVCIEKWCYRLLLPSDDMIWTDIADRVWHHKKHISLNLKTRQTLHTASSCIWRVKNNQEYIVIFYIKKSKLGLFPTLKYANANFSVLKSELLLV